MMTRRLFLALAAAAAQRGHAQTIETGTAFDRTILEDMARRRAEADYVAPTRVPDAWIQIDYDEYREIWFRHDSALWYDSGSPFEVDLFAPGGLFAEPVEIYTVENGLAVQIPFDLALFDRSDRFPDLGPDARLGYSGLRIRGGLVSPDILQEFTVFQGASYFRAIGAGETYGISARGLALGTGDGREEFPRFAAFWLETPRPGQETITVHALLDSPSVAGAYSFVLAPGTETVIDVQATLFARRRLERLGIGALTSMFLFDATNRDRFDDFRPAVHDSDGLMIRNGTGEQIWRPLANPRALQVSAFLDSGPVGFGLMQRSRSLSDFSDLESDYHLRPSIWISPAENWGSGRVELFEIPADREIYDNIVAFWRPEVPLDPGAAHRFGYRMTWGQAASGRSDVAEVIETRQGLDFDKARRIVTIDYAPASRLDGDLARLTPDVLMDDAPVGGARLERNPGTDGVRLSFDFDPADADVVEFRAQIFDSGDPVSEVWLYRWTA